jgi:hypothetical protein
MNIFFSPNIQTRKARGVSPFYFLFLIFFRYLMISQIHSMFKSVGKGIAKTDTEFAGLNLPTTDTSSFTEKCVFAIYTFIRTGYILSLP